MPISTRREGSTPSTCSRKPCTKCWRDCSPSPTMSMPTSSCTLRARRVASRLASSSSEPASRQGAQSRLGSASQVGLGRLPAMVVSNMAPAAETSYGSAPEPSVEVVVGPVRDLVRALPGHEAALAPEAGKLPGAGARHHRPPGGRRAVLVRPRAAEHEGALAAVQPADDALESRVGGRRLLRVEHQRLGGPLALDDAAVAAGDVRPGELRRPVDLGVRALVPALDAECALRVSGRHIRTLSARLRARVL